MKYPLIYSVFLPIVSTLLTFGTAFSDTKIEEYDSSGPLQLMFQDHHNQKKLTPSQTLNRKAVAAMGKQSLASSWKR